MKTLFIFILTLNSAAGFAQDSANQLHKDSYFQEGSVIALNSNWQQSKKVNAVCFETGMFHRGLLGASYHRLNFNRGFLASAGLGAGIGGTPGTGINQFYYATSGIGFKFYQDFPESFYISIGADLKYATFKHSEYIKVDSLHTTVEIIPYEGIGIMPYIGLTIVDKGHYIVQMRMAPLFLMSKNKIGETYPGVGITAGKLF